ncbi:MAG: ATP-binding protein, partial [Planctomycetota bacterium]
QQVIPASSPFQSTSTQMSSEQAGSCRHQIAIISGKGGTGKTTITACFSQLADRHVLADTDVDAADLHLLLEPCRHGGGEFIGGNKARIHADRCRACGRCVVACRFDAITDDGQTPTVDEHACEGCGLCMRVCPHQAIICEPRVSGHWFVSDTDQGTLVHAELGIGEENSGKLVHRVRQEARLRAAVAAVGVLADGPPGTGCPVIASIGGCDLAVLITEPTVSGVHDLERVLALCGHFQVPAAVLLNKADLDREQAERVQTLARQFHARLIGAIPFDPAVHEALMAGRTVLDHGDGPAARAIRSAWDQVESLLDEGAP